MSEIDRLFAFDEATNAWFSDANCRGMDAELFFPGRGESVSAAISVCRECEVRPECLEYALDNCEIHGVWGGTSERERRRIKRDRRLQRRVGAA